jgi:hypothetical protein
MYLWIRKGAPETLTSDSFPFSDVTPFVDHGGTVAENTCNEVETAGSRFESSRNMCTFASHFDIACGCSVLRSEDHVNCDLCHNYSPFNDNIVNSRYGKMFVSSTRDKIMFFFRVSHNTAFSFPLS